MQASSSEDQIREGILHMLLGWRLVVARQMPVREAKVFLRLNGIPVARNMYRAAGMRERRTEHRCGSGQQGNSKEGAT
jgi:hypothetical protein